MMEESRWGSVGLRARLCRRTVVIGLLAVLIGFAAGPAIASPDDSAPAALATFDGGLQYSSDGAYYADELPDLFASAPKLVPGETVERSFWLRNPNSSAVDVSFAQQRADNGLTVRVRAGANSTVTLAPGGTTNLAVEVRLPASADNTTQDGQSHVKLHFTVTESMDGELGNTGAGVSLLPLAAAALAVGAGAYLAARRRTSRTGNRTMEEGQA